MENRRVGSTELQVSEIGLGCNNFGFVKDLDVTATRHIIDRAIDCGINFFDTSDSYGRSEDFLGEVLGERRKQIILATKFGSQLDTEGKKKGASRAYILSAIESSLRRLKTEWIDLYQLHRPDPNTPMDETLRALDDLLKQGKVRYIGCSNLSPAQLREAEDIASRNGLARFVTSQDEYSLLVRGVERELLPCIEQFGMSELPYFPLANGLLTGKYQSNQPPPPGTRLADKPALAERHASPANWAKVARLAEFASGRGHSLLQLAFSWLLSRPAVASVIAGATRPEQVESNSRAGGWQLSSEELREIDRITAGT